MQPRSAQLKRTLRLFGLSLLLPLAQLAAQLDPPARPDDPASAMYTLEDIYRRLATGADGMLRGAGFVEPTTGPMTTGRTLNEIMGVAPLSDDGSGLDAALCVAGRTFWSLVTASWGPQVCTAPIVGQENVTPGATAQAISAGFHDGTGIVAGDPDLASTNIASGVEIFGVSGSALLASGDATDSQVLEGATYSNDSGPSTGNMPNVGQQNITPGTTDQTISAGFHDGTGIVAGDPDLASTNIASGVEIFGISGSALLASGDATDSQVLDGVSYSNDSGPSTGTIPNVGQQNVTPGTADQIISAGFHDGSGIVAGDPDLTASNIATGVEVFGVNGGAVPGHRLGDRRPSAVRGHVLERQWREHRNDAEHRSSERDARNGSGADPRRFSRRQWDGGGRRGPRAREHPFGRGSLRCRGRSECGEHVER